MALFESGSHRIYTSVLLLCGIAVICSIGLFYRYSSGHRARVDQMTPAVARQEWPKELLEFLNDAEKHGVHAENVAVYKGSEMEYYWSCDYQTSLLDFMKSRWKLAPATAKDHEVVENFVLHYMPSLLLSKLQPGSIEYYFSPEWRGEGGPLHCVMFDRTRKQIVVQYYFRF